MSLSDVVAVIPARYGSHRFPGKPLALIDGVPLVLRVHDRVTRAIPARQVIVATDDTRIRDCCERAGVRVAMTSRTCLTGTDRAWQAVRGDSAQVVLNVQGDEPLIESQDILTVLESWRSRGHGVTNAMCAIAQDADASSRDIPKVVVGEDGRLAYISRATVPFHALKRDGRSLRRQVCIYAIGRPELERFASLGRRSLLECGEDVEVLRFLDLGIDVHMVEVSGESMAVDVPEDVARVEAALQQRER